MLVRATGLKHMNHFVGDSIYCVCTVKHADGGARLARCETKPVSENLNPEWNETHELEPWRPGESLEFVVYDKGLLGSRVEGTTTLASSRFYPDGFDGTLELSGVAEAHLHVRIAPSLAPLRSPLGAFVHCAPSVGSTSKLTAGGASPTSPLLQAFVAHGAE